MIGALFVLAALVILIVSLLAIVRVGDNRDHRQAQRIMAMRRHPAEDTITERTHLSKAQAALDDAGSMDVELGAKALPDKFKDLLTLATVQAHVASAEALTRIAEHLDSLIEIGGVASTAPQRASIRVRAS